MEEAMVAMASILLFALNVLGSALLAGLIAVIVTKTAATWGGVVGGFIGSTPTLVIPLSIGIALNSTDSAAALYQAMWIAPVGIFLASTFLVTWRLLPMALPKSLPHRLTITVVVSLFCWLSGAIVCYFGTGALQRIAHLPIQVIGGVALLCNFALSGPAACIKATPAPKAEKVVSGGTYALRASLAGSVVGGAVLVSKWDPTLAGIGAGFPAIALTSLVSLWASRGEKTTAGAVGPIMLGGLSASTYCLAFGTLHATLFGAGLGLPLSLLLALSASYLSAVLVVSVPVFVTFRWVAAITKKRRSRRLEVEEGEGVMVEEEDEENVTVVDHHHQPHLNNRGAIAELYASQKGEAAPLLASSSGHHPTYHACASGGENDWKGREDCMALSRMAVRRHLSEETEQRIKMKGHDRPSAHDHDRGHYRRGDVDDATTQEEEVNEKKEEERRRWVDVVVVQTRRPEGDATRTITPDVDDPRVAAAGAVDMGGSGEVEGKLQPTLNERTLTPLR